MAVVKKAGLSDATLKFAAQAVLKFDKYTVVEAHLDGEGIQFSAVSKSGAVTLSGEIREPQGELDLEQPPEPTDDAPGANEVAENEDEEDAGEKH